MGIYSDKNKANALLSYARKLSKQKKYSELEKLMDMAIKDCPRGAFYITRGICKKNQGKFEEALNDYNTALTAKMYRNAPSAYVNRAIVLFNLQRYPECLEDFAAGYRLGFQLNSKHIKMMMTAKESIT